MDLEILYLDEAGDGPGEAAWETFVDASPDATFFHRAGWRRVIARCYGHRPYFCYARRGGRVAGILPLVHVRSPLFGNALISTGFCVYGGIVADDPTIAAALAAHAGRLGGELGVDYVELRHRAAQPIGWTVKSGLYATFQRPLPADPAEIIAALPERKRADIRRGLKNGLRLQVDQGIDVFYRIYTESVRNLGTPVYPRRFFAALRDEFGAAVEVEVVHGASGPVATIMSFLFKNQVMPYFGGSLPEARSLNADDVKYWRLMERAVVRGATLFDFGRSKRGTGSFDYKLNWGFRPQPLEYQYHLVRRKTLPDINPLNPKYRLMAAMWQRLPLPVANRLGPLIARQLG